MVPPHSIKTYVLGKIAFHIIKPLASLPTQTVHIKTNLVKIRKAHFVPLLVKHKRNGYCIECSDSIRYNLVTCVVKEILVYTSPLSAIGEELQSAKEWLRAEERGYHNDTIQVEYLQGARLCSSLSWHLL